MTTRTVPAGDAARPARSLPDVVAGLLDPQRKKILVEGRSPDDGGLVLEAHEVTVRPLWTELLAATRPSGESSRGGGRGNGLPISLDVIDLVDRIRDTADAWASAQGLPRLVQDPRRCGGCGSPLAACEVLRSYAWDRHPDMACCARCDRHPRPDRAPRLLRRLAVHHWPDPALRDQLARILERLTEHAAALLAGDQTSQYVRDTRCPRCWAWDVREPDAGERHPALQVVRHRERVVATECTACGFRWPWDGQGADGPLAAELVADRVLQAREGRNRAC